MSAHLALALAVLLVSSVGVANAQKIQTTLILEGVPEKAYAGDTISFNGRLVRADTGEGIAKASIMLKNENALTKAVIATGSTDDDGRFSINWIAESKEKDTVKVYAVYMGSADYSDSQSQRYTFEVERAKFLVQTDKEVYTNDEQLVIFGSGRPNDALSVFVTTSAHSVVFATKITVDETGKFNANLLKWDNSRDRGTYLVYVRSVTDIPSSERVIIFFAKQVIQQPQGMETVLKLDPPRNNVTINDDLSFTGKLETKTGLPIKEAIIKIKYKDDAKDGILAQWVTSDDGRFFINWKASQVNANDFLKIYGSFDGGNGFLPSVSEQHEIKFKPRKLTLELNNVKFGPNDLLVASGIAPPKERLSIKVLNPEGHAVVTKSLLVGSGESYEKSLMYWTRPSYVLPEGEYLVNVETENFPVLVTSKIFYFEEPKPLSPYKIIGSVWYEDLDGSRIPLEGAKVKITSPYGTIESYTDRSGKYMFQDLHAIIQNLKSTSSLTVELDGKYFKLIDGSNLQVVSKRITNIKFDGSLQDITVEPAVFSTKSEVAAARIFAMQNDIVRFYTDVIDLEPKNIDIEIFSEETSKGKYGYETELGSPKIWIGKGVSSPRNPYTWDTLAHEYTHYMQDLHAGVSHYLGMNHGGFSNPNTADSMVEGFADFMSAAISQHYMNERAEKFLQYSLESNFKVTSKFLAEELAIAGVFWDIYDEGEGDDDTISLGINDIWKIMSDEYYFPSYHEDSGVNAMKRHVYYLKDLHYILTQDRDFKDLKMELVEELFNNHGIINGFTDSERPGRI